MALPGAPFYIAHKPAGSTGANDLFRKNSPLGGGRMQMLLGNNAMWLEQTNALRVLANHPGFYAFNDHGAGGYPFSGPPATTSINWNLPSQAKVGDIGANACLGFHYAWPFYGRPVFPKLQLKSRYRTRTASTKIAFYMGAVPGHGFVTPSSTHTGTVLSNADTNFHNLTLTLDLSRVFTSFDGEVVAPSGFQASSGLYNGLAEQLTLSTFTVYVGAVVSSDTADWLGLSLYLIPPEVA